MIAAELFQANLALVDRVIASVCRRAGLRDEDAEDFASTAKLALIENDYAILRSYEGRAPLGAFLTVVVQRLLTQEWIRARGRWRSSAEAERIGPAAVLLEKLIVREGRSLDEAIPIVQSVDPTLDRQSARALADRLPPRPARPRLVPMPEDEVELPAPEAADARVREAEVRDASARAARVVRETLESMPLEDRMLVRFRFGAGMSIADASRLIGVPQRPLYRRIDVLLAELRTALQREGLDASVAADLISAGEAEMFDFGLGGKSAASGHTPTVEDT